MAASFVVEDGTGKSDANAYCTQAEADQYHENFGSPTAWSGAAQPDKEAAIREATQYMDLWYNWNFYKTNSEQALEWPRAYAEDKDGFAIGSNVIPNKIKNACAYLALQKINGDVLLPVQQDEAAIKKFKNVIGPLSEEVEFQGAERPEKSYTIADEMVKEFITVQGSGMVELTRA